MLLAEVLYTQKNFLLSVLISVLSKKESNYHKEHT